MAGSLSVIYDKSEAGHRDNNIVLNAWKEVIALVDFVNDTTEEKILFQNIRKRYCKYRLKLTKADKTGTSLAEKEAAMKAFQPYRYLQWLDKFIAKRDSKSNLPRPTDSLIMPYHYDYVMPEPAVLQSQRADCYPEETEGHCLIRILKVKLNLLLQQQQH